METKAMNVTVGTGRAVHAQFKGATICGAEGRGPVSSRLTAVEAAVTCKRCIKVVGERAAVPAPQEATQDEAETVESTPAIELAKSLRDMRYGTPDKAAETPQETTSAAKGMIPKAQRVSQQEADSALCACGRVARVNAYGTACDQWPMCLRNSSALRNTGHGNDGVARVYLVETIKHGDTHSVERVEITATGLTWSAVNSLVGKSPYYATPLGVRDRTVRDVWAQFRDDAPRVTHGWADYSVEVVEPMALDEAATDELTGPVAGTIYFASKEAQDRRYMREGATVTLAEYHRARLLSNDFAQVDLDSSGRNYVHIAL